MDLVVFNANGLTFAVERAKTQTLAPDDPCVPTLTQLLQLPALPAIADARRQQVLHFSHPQGELRLRVDDPVYHYTLPGNDLYPLPSLLAARLHLSAVRALARLTTATGGTLAIVLDPWRLINT